MERGEIVLLLKDIGYRPRHFKFTVSPEEMDYDGEYSVVSDARILVTVARTDTGYRLKVEGEVRVRFVCSRCLDEYEEDFVFEDENLLRRGRYEGGISLKDEDVESIFIEKDEIDLLPIIREIFISQLPINPLCSPDCRGLCPVCGLKLEAGVTHEHDHRSDTRKLGVILQAALKEGGKK
ncbi:MAG: DUF177 domain-containing protein [Thermotogae bacterium]|nr:DUF177 domain-containing protein [Thermotogota bacterium]